MRNYQEASTKKANPLLPFLGFLMLVILGGFAFLVAPYVLEFLTSTEWSFGPAPVLPLSFPPDWPPIAMRSAVAFGLFLVLFAVTMIPIIAMMGSPEGPTDVSLKEIRDDKKRKVKQRLGR